ncbi:MAG TPA: imidazole glycerol phosphate synthase subunit HisH [Ignavibacteriaceae bacterium]|nr:imidazole glycerol phosphate synthase subunit HisH [Ignavibacteriaceae bacterium]
MLALIQCENKEKELTDILKKLGQKFIITNNELEICKSDKVILCGSGTPVQNMKLLHMLNLYSLLRIIKIPILGIGLGVELMSDHTEGEKITYLGLFPIESNKFPEDKKFNSQAGLKKVEIIKPSKLFNGIESGTEFYFSENYYMPESEYTTSVVEDGFTFSASVEKGNAFGVQFHPEKSGEKGLVLLKNFINL